MTVNDSIVYLLTTSKGMLLSFTKDFSPADWLHRPCPKANCAAWLIGHLTLTERRALQRVGLTDLPALPPGFETRFARDETAPHASEFADASLLPRLFEHHRDLLIDAVSKLPPQAFDQLLENPSPRFKTLGEMLNFMALHVIMHTGQISTIRRSLGRPPLV